MLIVSLAVLLTSVSSQPADARWHLDLQAGALIPTSDVEFSEDGHHIDDDLDVGGAFAAEGGYAFERWADLTGRLQTGATFDNDENVDVFSLTVGGRFFPLPMTSRVRPWIGGQIGWYHTDADIDDFIHISNSNGHGSFEENFDKHDDSFGLNVGGGLDFPINQRVSLGIDVRYNNAFDAFKGFEFVTTMFNVSIWFGNEDAHLETTNPDTPPVPRAR